MASTIGSQEATRGVITGAMEVFTSQEEMISSFKALYKAHFGIDLTDDQALTEGMNLMHFMQYMHPELDTIKQRNYEP